MGESATFSYSGFKHPKIPKKRDCNYQVKTCFFNYAWIETSKLPIEQLERSTMLIGKPSISIRAIEKPWLWHSHNQVGSMRRASRSPRHGSQTPRPTHPARPRTAARKTAPRHRPWCEAQKPLGQSLAITTTIGILYTIAYNSMAITISTIIITMTITI